MFIFRWFKKLLIIIGLGTVIYWGVQFVNTNSPVRERVDKFMQSALWKEGVKDMKSWAGELFQGVGKKIEGEEVTADEKKQLDDILMKEIYGNQDKETKRLLNEAKTKLQIDGAGSKAQAAKSQFELQQAKIKELNKSITSKSQDGKKP